MLSVSPFFHLSLEQGLVPSRSQFIAWLRTAEIVLMGIDTSQPEAEVLGYFKRFEEDTFALRAWMTGRTSIIDDMRMWDAIRDKNKQ